MNRTKGAFFAYPDVRDLSDSRTAHRSAVTAESIGVPWARRFERGALSEAVAEQIEQLILSGELNNGTQLPPEGTLATSMGVSRSVMREALVHLRARGLVETVNGRGTFVSNRETNVLSDALLRQLQASGATAEAIVKLFEARMAIETRAAVDACRHATVEDLEAMQRQLDEMRSLKQDAAAFARADMGFHLAVVDAAHNPFLTTLLTPLIHVIETGVITSQFSSEAVDTGIRGHTRVLRAITARHEGRAEAAMSRHLEQSLEYARRRAAHGHAVATPHPVTAPA